MNGCLSLTVDVQSRLLLTLMASMFMFSLSNFDTSLLLFLKGHVEEPVNSNGMF